MTAAPALVRLAEEFRGACDAARASGARVGLVPTMGALHEGHLGLVRAARSRADFVAVSIFVNPTQFGPNEDLARYPRDLDGDLAKVASAGADIVFAPDVASMYPPGDETRVHVGALASTLCGPFRPGHFEGVTTVVAKLFALTGACTALFGRKDYQQLTILKRMATDLFFPVAIVGHAIVREADGLAMSSRNAYLSPPDRDRALGLSRGLRAAANAFASGERSAAALRKLVHDEVARVADSIDYVDIAGADDLRVFDATSRIPERAVIAIACRIGTTRLIDNIVLGEDAPF